MNQLAADDRLSQVFDHIAAHHDSFIKRLMDYVRHPSISAHNIGIEKVAGMLVEMLVEMLDGLGMEAEAVATAGHPMVLGRRGHRPDVPTVMFYRHYDVQPPEPLELWGSPPFEPTIRDGRIYARGVGDNKGQHFAQLLAVESWRFTATCRAISSFFWRAKRKSAVRTLQNLPSSIARA
jgi:acetylornithine deacetylase/succinyl-diaminopimelate desuccinylase-like protein